MKVRILYLVGAFCLITAFWACGGGDLYYPETDDLVAVEKLEKLSPKELDAMMDSCLADAKCSAKWDSALGRPEWKSKAKSSSSRKASSSSKEASSSSKKSSSSSKEISSADSDKSSSSKRPDPASSSSEPKEESSSQVVPETSGDATDSSSEEEESSSSEEDPISSAESSSSEEPPEESSSSVSSSSFLPPSGTCRPDKAEAKKGEPVTWTYYPDEGTLHNGYFRWEVDGTLDMEFYIEGEKGFGFGEFEPVVVVYREPGYVTGTSIVVGTSKNDATEIECDVTSYVRVLNEDYSSSSSIPDIDDPPPVSTSTSTNSSSSKGNGDPPPGPSL